MIKNYPEYNMYKQLFRCSPKTSNFWTIMKYHFRNAINLATLVMCTNIHSNQSRKTKNGIFVSLWLLFWQP